MNTFAKPIQITSVSVTTALTAIWDAGSTATTGQESITIPLHALTGYLYVLACRADRLQADGSTAIDATYIQNYGVRYEATDKVATINATDNVDILAVTSAGTFTAYPTRWCN